MGAWENSAKFDSETGFIFPRTRRFAVGSMASDDLLEAIESEFSWPILIRPAHTNLGEGMYLIDDPDMLREHLSTTSLKDCFVIQYHECRDDEGISRACRALVIAGELFIERMDSQISFKTQIGVRRSPQWQELGFDRDEQALLADPDQILGFDLNDTFAPILTQTPLDIFGFDFGVTRDGRPIVFEINASMNLFNMRNAKLTPYLAEHYDFLNDTVVGYLRHRAGKPKAS